MAAGAVALSLVLVAALHVLRPELRPAGHRLSEYANGPHGWLMAAAFVVLALGVVALAAAIGRDRPPGGVPALVRVALGGAGAGLVLSALFPTARSAGGEAVHSLASGGATIVLVGVAVLWSLRSPAAADRAGGQRPLAAAAAAAALVSPLLHDTALTGVGQRVLWGLLAAWLVRAAGRLARPAP